MVGNQDNQDNNSALNIEIYPYIPERIEIEVYAMPRDRDLKNYCHLYFDLIPKPDLIIYNVDRDSSSL